MRHFNTAGPVDAADHYTIPPLERVDVDEVLDLVAAKKYFVLHAPRQTGKTSALIELRDRLNGGQVGDYHCVQVNVEVAQVALDDVERGVRATMSSIAECALLLGDDYPDRVWPDILAREGVKQTREYMTKCGVRDGHLVVFDRRAAPALGSRRRALASSGVESKRLPSGFSSRWRAAKLKQRPPNQNSIKCSGVHNVLFYKQYLSAKTPSRPQ